MFQQRRVEAALKEDSRKWTAKPRFSQLPFKFGISDQFEFLPQSWRRMYKRQLNLVYNAFPNHSTPAELPSAFDKLNELE